MEAAKGKIQRVMEKNVTRKRGQSSSSVKNVNRGKPGTKKDIEV